MKKKYGMILFLLPLLFIVYYTNFLSLEGVGESLEVFLEIAPNRLSYYDSLLFTMLILPIVVVFGYSLGNKISEQRIIREKSVSSYLLKNEGRILLFTTISFLIYLLIGLIVPIKLMTEEHGTVAIFTTIQQLGVYYLLVVFSQGVITFLTTFYPKRWIVTMFTLLLLNVFFYFINVLKDVNFYIDASLSREVDLTALFKVFILFLAGVCLLVGSQFFSKDKDFVGGEEN